MKTIRSSLLALTAAVAVANGCASARRSMAENAYEYPAASEQTTLTVSNNNWSDINVYVVRGGLRYRLGTVTSNTTRTFKLPQHVMVSGDVPRLLADPIGSNTTYLSPPLLIAPGQSVEWRVENNLNLSTAFIK